MKASIVTTAIVGLSILVKSSAAFAQDTDKNASDIFSPVNYIAYHSSDKEAGNAGSLSASKASVKESSSVSAAYRSTEQFVFNNLSSLKKIFAVPDIYFDLDASAIRADSEPVLNHIVNLMTEHPEISIAATAHCDSRNSGYNQKLAIRRAESAKAYLVSKGISSDRIVIEKHGRPAAVNPCSSNPGCTLDEQQLNRRTEFNVIVNNINLAHVSSFAE